MYLVNNLLPQNPPEPIAILPDLHYNLLFFKFTVPLPSNTSIQFLMFFKVIVNIICSNTTPLAAANTMATIMTFLRERFINKNARSYNSKEIISVCDSITNDRTNSNADNKPKLKIDR